eukprot:403354091
MSSNQQQTTKSLNHYLIPANSDPHSITSQQIYSENQHLRNLNNFNNVQSFASNNSGISQNYQIAANHKSHFDHTFQSQQNYSSYGGASMVGDTFDYTKQNNSSNFNAQHFQFGKATMESHQHYLGYDSRQNTNLDQQRFYNQDQKPYNINHSQMTFHNQSFNIQRVVEPAPTLKVQSIIESSQLSDSVDNDSVSMHSKIENKQQHQEIIQTSHSHHSSITQSSMPIEQSVNLSQLRQKAQNEINDKVMSRSDWFSFLKIAYLQLSKLELNSTQNQDQQRKEIKNNDQESEQQLRMVNRDNFYKLVEFNSCKIPLKSLEEYLGSCISDRNQDKTVRKEKWLSFGQVMQCIKSMSSTQDNQIYWDDIIDSLMLQIQEQNKPSSIIANSKQDKQTEIDKEIQNKIVKIVLKDSSVLLDLSKVKACLMNSSKPLTDHITQSLDDESINNIRAISFSTTLMSKNQNLTDLSALKGLVILNLSNMNLKPQDLKDIQLQNLLYLNIANNQLQDITLVKQSFPQLKELNASHNKFNSAKFTTKIDTLKVLDLSYNEIDLYEEIICLAFLNNLVVLNLNHNPLSYLVDKKPCPQFEDTVRKLLPKIKILNPPSISKVSCFENFKDLAFSIGNLDVDSNQQSRTSLMNSDSDISKVFSKQINMGNLAQNNEETSQNNSGLYRVGDISKSEFSINSSPIKILFQDKENQISKRTEIALKNNQSPISYHKLRSQSPCLTENQVLNINTPSKILIMETNNDKSINKSDKSILNKLDNSSSANILVTSQQDNTSTFDSNLHKKLEETQKILVKNDHLKYFNQYSKNLDSQSAISECERLSLQSRFTNNLISPYENMQNLQHQQQVKKDEKQKPPRYIKIKPTSTLSNVDTSVLNESQNPLSARTQQHDSRKTQQIVQSQGGGNIAIHQNLNNERTLSQASELHQSLMYQNKRPTIKRDMSVKLSSQEGNFQKFELSQKFVRRENSSNSMRLTNQIGNDFPKVTRINETTIFDDNQSDMALYYEQQKSSMNIRRIREMPSKELCKINNPSPFNNACETSISPIKAMMISKPPTDEQLMQHQQNKSSSNSVNKFTNVNSSQTNRSSIRESPAILEIKIYVAIKFNNRQEVLENYTKKIIQKRDQLAKIGFSIITKLKKYKQEIQSLMIKVTTGFCYQQSPVAENQSMTQDVRPFNIPTDSDQSNLSPLTKQQHQKEGQKQFRVESRSKQSSERKNLKNITNYTGRQEITEGPMTIDDLDYSHNSYAQNKQTAQVQFIQNADGHNTPRFSQRMNMQKELRYHDAVEMINCKRKKKEQKKQLYNSLTGKAQNIKQKSRQLSTNVNYQPLLLQQPQLSPQSHNHIQPQYQHSQQFSQNQQQQYQQQQFFLNQNAMTEMQNGSDSSMNHTQYQVTNNRLNASTSSHINNVNVSNSGYYMQQQINKTNNQYNYNQYHQRDRSACPIVSTSSNGCAKLSIDLRSTRR